VEEMPKHLEETAENSDQAREMGAVEESRKWRKVLKRQEVAPCD
jgi:hypothetical protein